MSLKYGPYPKTDTLHTGITCDVQCVSYTCITHVCPNSVQGYFKFGQYIVPLLQLLHAMGKLRKAASATKTRVFETTSVHTWRGSKIVNVAIETPPTPKSTSRN